MNNLGIAFIWLAMQVTLFCFVVLMVHLVARQRNAGSATPTFTGLLLIIGLTATLLIPMPRWSWNTPSSEKALATSTTNSSQTVATDTEAAPTGATLPPQEMESTFAAAFAGFANTLGRELAPTSDVQSKNGLSWTGWFAVVVLAMVAFGLLRLLVGWVSVRRCLTRSAVINCQSLDETLDVLRAEINCRKPVTILESDELASAATVGWRKPVILLPSSWSDWTPEEQRMVLAHELAHIVADDAAAWMAAQIGLLLHFYHPLVHWLAARLRLEQELAADAKAAELTGGSQSYLVTLAELAVREPHRAVTWPARAFLPTRGTLLRRIEMLRDKPTGTDRSPRWRRHFVIAVTVIAAIFVAGLQRPDSGVAVAQTPAAQAAAPATEAAAFNLDSVPKSVVLLAGIRPFRVAAREEMQPLVKLMEESTVAEKTGIRIADIDQFLIMAVPRANVDRPQLAEPVLELRMLKPTDFSGFMKHHIGVGSTNQSVDGFSVVANNNPVTEHSRCAFMVDERTVLFGPWHALKGILESRRDAEGGPDWMERLQTVDKGDALFAFDVIFLRGEMEQQFRQRPNPMLGMVAPLWQNTNQVIAGAGIGDEMSLSVHGWGDDEAAAEKIQTTLQALIPVANGMLMGAKASAQNAEGPEKKAMTESIAIAENVMPSVKVTRDGNKVTVDATGEGIKLATMTGLLLPAIQASREAALRTQGQNNIKQIFLGLHSYYDVNGSFPPAVLLGPDGKTKYSWRVAILPYIDQANLYNAYDRNEPWDGPNNRKLLDQIPETLRSPKAPKGSLNTSYFALVGEHTAFGNAPGKGRSMLDITDGTSITIMVVETKRETPWTKPEDIPYSADDPLPKFGGYHEGGFQVGIADGRVRFVSENIDMTLLRSLITCDGGEVVNF